MKIEKKNETTINFITLDVDGRLLSVMHHLMDGELNYYLPVVFKCQFEVSSQLLDNLLEQKILPDSFRQCIIVYHSFFRDDKEVVEDLSDWFTKEYLKGGNNE